MIRLITRVGEQPELVVLSHAVDRSGPPVYLLHLLRWIAANTDTNTRVISLEGGELRGDFDAVTHLQIIGEPDPVRLRRGSRPATRARDALRRARLSHIDPRSLVYVNTAWSVRALRYLPAHMGVVASHIHELSVGLEYHLGASDRELMHRRTRHWIAASGAVAANLSSNEGVAASDITVHHEMVDTSAPKKVTDAAVDARRASIGVGPDDVLVGTTAVGNWRKGPDLFAELAARVLAAPGADNIHLVWVGLDERSPQHRELGADLASAGIGDRVHLVGVSDTPETWMRAFDMFVLPAREDAYPLVCLEAAAASNPIVCFDAGGMVEFVRDDAGIVVDFPDVGAMANAVVQLCKHEDTRARMGAVALDRVVADHDIAVAAPKIWRDIETWMIPS